MKPTIKYLLNGEYHYATVKDIGDIEKLQTRIKSDLVGAINSLIGQIGEVEIPEDLLDRLEQFESDIDSIMNSGFNEQQIVELQEKLGSISGEINDRIESLEGEYSDKLDKVTSDYDGKVADINTELNNVKENLGAAEAGLEDTRKKLSSVELNVTEVTETADFVRGKLETKVDSTEFNLLEATVKGNSTSITQNKKDIELKASTEDLSLATDRVSKAEADIKLNAEGITSSVKRDELRKELDKISIFGSNILANTRDWNGWEANVPARAYLISETYNHLHIQEQTGSGNYLEDTLTGLEVGKTYAASVYAKSSSVNAKAILRINSTQYEMKNQNDDIFISTSWERLNVVFVAPDTEVTVSFTASNVDNSVTTHFSGAKIEDGSTHTGWQPNENDTYERLVSAESAVKQQADQITSIVDRQEQIGEDVISQTTQINQMSDKIGLHAEKIEEIDGEVSRQKASIELNADSILSKVEQDDIDRTIEGISLDKRNLILNSDFILGMDSWSNINENFELDNVNGKNHLKISRSGLSGNMVASASSNMFATKAGDRLSIGLDVTVENLAQLDVETVVVLDLFDINDNRVYFEEFNISDLEGELSDGETGRLTARYAIDREDVAKARLRLTLYRNGSVSFTNITIEKGDIKSVGWTPAPEDSQLVQANMKTMIDQNASDITLRAESDTVDKLTEDLESNSAELKIASDKIEANIESLSRVDGTLEEHSAKITATAEELSSKMSSTEVNDLLESKKYATQSELNQTSGEIKASVSSIEDRLGGVEQRVEETLYTWVVWADDEFGNGISILSSGKTHMGIAQNKPSEIPSLTPSDYVWTRVQGNEGSDGKSAYELALIGGFIGTEKEWLDSLEADDVYKVELVATNGSTFKNGVIDTLIQAIVYKGSNDVTDDIDANRFRWKRVSLDSEGDTEWNNRYFGGVKEVQITRNDVSKRATFMCDILKENDK